MMVAKSPETRQRGSEHRAGLVGFELLDKTEPEELSVRAADRAVDLLSAGRAPSGRFPVVFHPTITGLLTHEAIGHNAEADLVFAGESILDGKLGTRVAPDCVTPRTSSGRDRQGAGSQEIGQVGQGSIVASKIGG